MLSIGGAVLQKKVLIVDDEKNIVDIIAFNLKKEGFQVIKAGDGEEGLKKHLNNSQILYYWIL